MLGSKKMNPTYANFEIRFVLWNLETGDGSIDSPEIGTT